MTMRIQLTVLATLVAFNAAAAPAPKQEPPPPKVDPVAIAALVSMGAFVRAQPKFEVKTKSATDTVLADGQKVQQLQRGDIRVQRPDELRVEVISDRKHRQFFYDGKTFAIYGPKNGYYAKVPAPPTIAELVDVLQDKYDIEMPLVDLFRWGTEEAGIDQITAASIVGSETIDGVETDHYAFRQAGVDWQVWIERGSRPVPHRLVVTTLDDPARPEHTVDMTWNLDPSFEASTFAFVPPPNSHEIDLVATALQPEKKKGATP